MSKSLKVATLLVAGLIATPALAGQFGLGREALPEEVAAWNIDVRPDGQGLPEGHGSVEMGEQIFSDQCAACHGDFAEGVDRWPELAGGRDSLKSENPIKTVGSYWPYLSTVFDYIRRAMPFGAAQSLSPDEVYAVIAYILNMNDIVDADFELSRENFLSVNLPNEKGFIDDPRPDVPTVSAGGPCMKDCKPDATITMRARILDVTPTDKENPSGSIE